MRKLVPALLLSLCSSVYAADHFDRETQILTIPQIVVADKTFSNVRVRLIDFQVLAADAYPLVGVVNNGFLVQFLSAVRQQNQVQVSLLVTSQFQDTTAVVGNFSRALARLTDDRGNIYNRPAVRVGNVQSNNLSVSFPFAANIATTVTLTFNNVASNATSVGDLDFVINGAGSADPTFSFTNIPFQN